MTTTLTDKQLHAAYWTRASGTTNAISEGGLRAVADLAITHQEADNHALRSELERAEDQANNLAGDNAELTRRLEELQEK